MDDIGSRFVTALAAKDTAALLALFTDPVELRGLTPGRFWEASTPEEAVHDVLYRWFEPSDAIETVESVETGRVQDRHRVDYRLLVRNPEGLHLVEQRGYLDLAEDGRIERMQLVCAGFRPIEG